MTEKSKGGGWAVAYRVKATLMGEFHNEADDVDEATARKVFGRCIRAGELGLLVEGVVIDAVRLVRKVPTSSHSAGWAYQSLQEHETNKLALWKVDAAKGVTSPYREDCFHPGVPCLPGAWGGDGCAMHSGFDIDENGLCVEGRRAVKVLDLVVIPAASSMRRVWGFPATMTREELDEVAAFAVSELVHRSKGEGLTDEQLNRAVDVLEGKAGT